MARVLALVADLLFASRLQASLAGAGHEVELLGDRERLRERLHDEPTAPGSVLLVDLADPDLEGVSVIEELRRGGALAHTRTLGFYAHVDTEMRGRAQAAGFDLVVPRSRMNREGPALVEGLAARG